jgi:hypothetical protein
MVASSTFQLECRSSAGPGSGVVPSGAVGSGTGEEDRQVANAALAAFPGAKTF